VQHGGGGGVVPATHLAGMVLLVWVPFAGDPSAQALQCTTWLHLRSRLAVYSIVNNEPFSTSTKCVKNKFSGWIIMVETTRLVAGCKDYGVRNYVNISFNF